MGNYFAYNNPDISPDVDESKPKKLAFKVVSVGDSNVGKTSFIKRFISGDFSDSIEPTIQASFVSKTVEIEGTPVKCDLWDLAGEERYRSLAPMYFREAAGILLYFDLTNRGSFDNCKTHWFSQIENALQAQRSKMCVILIGTKCDKRDDIAVSFEEANQFALDNSMNYFETSAKENVNVTDSLHYLLREVSDLLPKYSKQKSARK